MFFFKRSKEKTSGPDLRALKMIIVTEKKIFDKDEPIKIKTEIRNVSKESVKVNKRFFPYKDVDLGIKMKGTGYIPVRTLPPDSPPKLEKKWFEILKPGQSVNFEYKLNRFFYKSLKPGVYEIIFKYKVDEEKVKKFKAWYGQINSNSLGITIKAGY